MKKTTKVLALLLCAVALVVGSVMGTLAYLTYTTEVVQNTFTVGNVTIDLDEAAVKEDGTYVTNEANRVKSNKYHLLPGHTYIKDPTVTVKAGSDDCYVRMKVQVANLDELMKAIPAEKYPEYYAGDVFLLQMLVTGWDNETWEFIDVEGNTYEFCYVGAGSKAGVIPAHQNNVDIVLPALFKEIVVPEFLDNTSISYLARVQINVTAEAIQADGFNTAADAWAKF